jgi:hypothetical protein
VLLLFTLSLEVSMRLSITFTNGINTVRECRCFTVYPHQDGRSTPVVVLHFDEQPSEWVELATVVSLFALPQEVTA